MRATPAAITLHDHNDVELVVEGGKHKPLTVERAAHEEHGPELGAVTSDAELVRAIAGLASATRALYLVGGARLPTPGAPRPGARAPALAGRARVSSARSVSPPDDRIVGKISAHILSGPPVSGDCLMQFTVSGQVIR